MVSKLPITRMAEEIAERDHENKSRKKQKKKKDVKTGRSWRRFPCCCLTRPQTDQEQALAMFAQIDDDGSGLLDIAELAELAKLLGATLSEPELKTAMGGKARI